MGKIRLMLMAAVTLALTLGLTGLASAATITCGDCHSVPPVNADNCNNTGRGLHGTHVNYSSAAYPKTVANNGKCSYCHTATPTKAPTLTHNDGYVNITGNASAKAPGLDIAGSTCANACHKNNATTAPWGNYTTASVKLTCVSCHDDLSDTAGLSGAHAGHIATAVNTGGTAMGAANNAGCVNCHENNVINDLWSGGRADDGTKKAYPHASDGTNVVAANASVVRTGMVVTRGSGTTDTCASSCHPRSASKQWGGSMDCDMCHYYEATLNSANNTGTGSLGGGQSDDIDDDPAADGKVRSGGIHAGLAVADTGSEPRIPVARASPMTSGTRVLAIRAATSTP